MLACSHLFLGLQGEDLREGDPSEILLEEGRLAYHEWGERQGVPLILSHGSPGGGGRDFEDFARSLAKERWVIAPDRWGFGRSQKKVDDYSFVADAEATVALMDALAIEEADVVGWSYGGGVVLEMASRYRSRVRSVGLLGAIGIQEGEGSGSYHVEQLKYELLRVTLMWIPEALPHFGLAGPDWFRRSFVRDFADADQRPLRAILSELEIPVLVVHGKDDPLVGAWVAEEHHALLANSRLEILAASHFFPVGGRGMAGALAVIDDFLGKVAEGAEVEETNYQTERQSMKALWANGPRIRGWKPWWLVMALSGVGAWFRPRLTLFVVTLGGGWLLWDSLIGLLAVFLSLSGKRIFAVEKEERNVGGRIFSAVASILAGSVLGGVLLTHL